jgi:hypothetical protein
MIAQTFGLAHATWATHKFYPDARHELFNEPNRDEVTGNLIGWLDQVRLKSKTDDDHLRSRPCGACGSLAFSGHLY